MKIFKNILGFLGLAATTTKIELNEEQIDKIDTSLGELQSIKDERDGLKTKVTELETAATAQKEKITALEGNVATLTTDKASAETKIETLTAEVARLGKLDGGKVTTTAGEKDKHSDEGISELSASQKELNEKVKNF